MTTYVAIKNEHKVAKPHEYLYKKPSSNEKISYTLVSLINHYGNSLDCGHYVSDVFYCITEIWWHSNDENITQISDLHKGVYYRETKKHEKNNVRINRCIIWCLYHNKPSEKHSSIFQEFTTISKITHMKKVIKYQYVFRKYFKVRQEVIDEIQIGIYYIKDELQITIEKNIFGKRGKNHFGCMVMD